MMEMAHICISSAAPLAAGGIVPYITALVMMVMMMMMMVVVIVVMVVVMMKVGRFKVGLTYFWIATKISIFILLNSS